MVSKSLVCRVALPRARTSCFSGPQLRQSSTPVRPGAQSTGLHAGTVSSVTRSFSLKGIRHFDEIPAGAILRAFANDIHEFDHTPAEK